MRVAGVRVVSEHPEAEAWERLKEWAGPRGLLMDTRHHPVFGFNNPSPLPNQKVYGYEFWIRVGPEAQSASPVEIKEVAGGKFAVMTHRGYPSPQAWKQLWEWAQSNGHRWRKSHELERMLEPSAREDEMTFDLYLPIED